MTRKYVRKNRPDYALSGTPVDHYHTQDHTSNGTAKAQGLVTEQMAGIHAEHKRLSELVDALSHRLTLVLQPEAPQPNGNGNVSVNPSLGVPLADQINSVRLEATIIGFRLQNIINRIDL